ncbi:MAG: hypothetical protein ACYSX1_12385, partial [Planctomycetota bacterium]
MTKPKIDELTKIAPVVRGLLAEATGNDDTPYSPVVLKALTNQGVTDTAADVMSVESIESGQASEETRKQLQTAIDAYVA